MLARYFFAKRGFKMIKRIIIVVVLLCAALAAVRLYLIKKDTQEPAPVCTYPAPKVTHFKWGEIEVTEVDGTVKKYKDAKLSPAGSKNWDWKATGTQHVPGIQIADLNDIIDADIFILSRGVDLILQTMPETENYLKNLGKQYYILQSEEAVKKYNELVDAGKKVAALIHSTC